MKQVDEARKAVTFYQYEKDDKVTIHAELKYMCKAEISLSQCRNNVGKHSLIDETKQRLRTQLLRDVFGQELIQMRQIINRLLTEVNV